VDGRAFFATGNSGDGKSTISGLARDAGAALLSDEILQVFPDGTVIGTPFRSDPDKLGQPLRAKLAWICGLVKGAEESIAPMSPQDAYALLLSQVMEVPSLALPRPELRRRLLGILGSTQLGRLTFRKHPDAGRFVVDLLRGA
jgi:hypothetical protein